MLQYKLLRRELPGDAVILVVKQVDVTYEVPQGCELDEVLSSEPRPMIKISDPVIIMQGVSNYAILLFRFDI